MGFGLILKGYESKFSRKKLATPIIEQVESPPFSPFTFCKSLGFNYNQVQKNTCLHKFGFKENKKLVKIGVLDTGIDNSHDALQGYISKDGLDASPLQYNHFNDQVGHGTHVAGIIVSELDIISELTQQTFNIEIVSLKFDHTYKAIEAFPILINKAIELNIDILNVSSNGDGGDLAEYTAFLKATQSGMEIVASAGNEGVNLNNSKLTSYPCSYPITNLTCVGNITDYDGINPRSNHGDRYVHVLAHGTLVKSTLPNNNWGRMSGTSQSSPKISAFAVYNLIQFNKNLSLKSGLKFYAIPESHVQIGVLDYSKLTKDNNKNFNNVGMVVKDEQRQ